VYGLLVFLIEFLPLGSINPKEVAEYFNAVGGEGLQDPGISWVAGTQWLAAWCCQGLAVLQVQLYLQVSYR
jgi:hypothetical protein